MKTFTKTTWFDHYSEYLMPATRAIYKGCDHPYPVDEIAELVGLKHQKWRTWKKYPNDVVEKLKLLNGPDGKIIYAIMKAKRDVV